MGRRLTVKLGLCEVEALLSFAQDAAVQATSRWSCPTQEVGVQNQAIPGR